MKKLIFLFLTGIVFTCSIHAQCPYNCIDIPMYDIFTPFCSPVNTWITDEDTYNDRLALDVEYAWRYPNANQIITYNGISSTRTFNCHGYTWLRTEGGQDRWIGASPDNSDPDIYYTDDSYTEVNSSPWPYPAKIVWERPGDHSGVTTVQTGIVNSKWNKFPLMSHATNYGPNWGSNVLKYYVRTTDFSINGPGQACSTGTGFTLTPSPKCPIQWSVSGPFTVSTPNPNNPSIVTVSYTGANNNSGTLTAKFNGVVVATKDITVCLPNISGHPNICAGNTYTFLATNWQLGYYWEKSPNLSLSSPATNPSVTVSANGNGTGWVSIRNSSGTELARYDVSVGIPERPYLMDASGILYTSQAPSYTLYYGSPTTSQQFLCVNPPGSAAAEWWSAEKELNPTHFDMFHIAAQVTVIPLCLGGGTFKATAVNSCGASQPITMHLTIKSPTGGGGKIELPGLDPGGGLLSPPYPNPVSDILTIDIKEDSTNLNFDVRLYDGMGNILRQQQTQGGTVQFNVSSLRDGIYYLHIYDGVNDQPEIQKIIVKR